ncbi:MAG: response regulator transcription factor [Turicibacter sp.]|nr:response regulator transcription factor [Turicibacter sp.]MEE0880114.1 response regulator transcription factor [Turicibacter sp.]CUP46271.1 Glycopeptide resistance-associated protein R [Turicibacter sanguinis]
MKKVLIIEDDLDLALEMKRTLEHWQFDVRLTKAFNQIIETFLEYEPMIIILDINLPFFDGFYWCEKIRQISTVPIIFLSSRDSNLDLMMAIHHGGDDYLTKPVSSDILVTKINAIMRRTYDYVSNSNLVYLDNLVVDFEKGTLKHNNKTLELTKNEMRILTTLIKQKGKIVTREQLMINLWNDDEFISDNTLTVNVNRLRARLKEIGIDDFIQTKKGIGYLIK